MTSTNSAFRPPQQQAPAPVPAAPVVSEETAERNSRDTAAAMYHIVIAGMVVSLFTSGTAFWQLTGHLWAAPEGSMVAFLVDYALLRWMRINQRLRAVSVESGSGKTLEFTTGGMTLYLNGVGPLALVITPMSHLAIGMLVIAHLFIPTVMIILMVAAPKAQLTLQRLKDQHQAHQAAIRRDAEDTERAERNAQMARRDELATSENKRLAAEEYARVRPGELEAEQRQREAEKSNRDREAAEREQIRVHTIRVASYLFLARRLQAAALASMHAGSAPPATRSNGARNGSPGPRTSPAPAPHQVSAPGGAPAPAPGPHQVGAPAAPGAAPGAHQVPAPAPHQASAPGGNGQVRPDIAWLADLAEPWLEANPGAGRIKLRQELVRLVNEAGAQAGEHLVRTPGAEPGVRITDDVGKKVLKEIKRRRDQREIEHLERLLSE